MGRGGRIRWAGLFALALATAVACSPDDTSAPEPTPSASSSPPSPSPATSVPATSAPATPRPSATPTPAAPVNPVSLQAMMTKKYNGSNLRLGRVLARNEAYTRYFVTYTSGTLTISGILNVPRTPGRHPGLVLNHGHIDTDIYTNGRGLMREQDYLARRGYVVLHTDYRNHAQSSKDPRSEVDLRLGYTEDAINAVLALKASPYVDPQRVGMFGRSMGGGVTYNVLVAQPGLVKAAIVYAPVSSEHRRQLQPLDPPGRRGRHRHPATHGEPARNPTFWRNVSPVNFFDRVTEPFRSTTAPPTPPAPHRGPETPSARSNSWQTSHPPRLPRRRTRLRRRLAPLHDQISSFPETERRLRPSSLLLL